MKIPLLVLLGLALALIVMTAAGALMSRRFETLDHADAPSDPETRFVETRSGRVHVLDVGAGEGEGDGVVLLLHGTGRSVADWQEGVAGLLAARNRVVAIDYYGHGLSDRAHGWRYGIALWARQAIDVLDALGIERVTVVGHSAGGCVAAILTADHPERVAELAALLEGWRRASAGAREQWRAAAGEPATGHELDAAERARLEALGYVE